MSVRIELEDSSDADLILAALRCYQACLEGKTPDMKALKDIATNGREGPSPDPDYIDDLCEQINCELAVA